MRALLRALRRWSTSLTTVVAVAGSTMVIAAVDAESVPDNEPEMQVAAQVRSLGLKSKPVEPDLRDAHMVAVAAQLREQTAVHLDEIDPVWIDLAECESNRRWNADTGNGYYGGLQFAIDSWRWVGGRGYPHEAPKKVQIAMAERLLERQGWHAWPACARQLGLL